MSNEERIRELFNKIKILRIENKIHKENIDEMELAIMDKETIIDDNEFYIWEAQEELTKLTTKNN